MSEASKKTAVILFNLGGPDSTESVRPFLFNLFNDKHIIRLPRVVRFVVAWLISSLRKNTAKQIYAHIGNKSPLLEETNAQREALARRLSQLQAKGKKHARFELFVCMRHWHPMAPEVLQNIKNFAPDEIILLPLYPQFSTTTSLSSFQDFSKFLNKALKDRKDVLFKSKIPVKTICCYPTEENFIEAHAELILKKVARKKNYRILFSATACQKK